MKLTAKAQLAAEEKSRREVVGKENTYLSRSLEKRDMQLADAEAGREAEKEAYRLQAAATAALASSLREAKREAVLLKAAECELPFISFSRKIKRKKVSPGIPGF